MIIFMSYYTIFICLSGGAFVQMFFELLANKWSQGYVKLGGCAL